jgi:hypothetical protein
MWKVVLGVLAFAQPVSQFVLWLLRTAGDIDFLVERLNDPGWIGVLAVMLIAPPPWLPFACVVVGLLLIWWFANRAGPAALLPLGTRPTQSIDLPAPETVRRDITVGEAAAFLATGQWGRDFYKIVGEKGNIASRGYDALLQAAADGLIPIWGKRSEWGVYEPIQTGFWYKNRIEFLSLCKGDAQTEASDKAFSGHRYISLMTSRDQVSRLSPQATEATGPDGEVIGAIRWRFLSPSNFFIAAKGRGDFIDIYGVQATGVNESDELISDFSGTIRSEVTGSEFPITVCDSKGNLVDPAGWGIPAKHQFRFQVRFFGDEPIGVTDFLHDFRRLTIRLRYNGTEYKRVISPEEIDSEVARAEKELRRVPPVRSAGIIKMSNPGAGE